MAFGTDEQKADFLPRILSGDIHFCIGYSEPGAGTDLASLKTRAVRDGDAYVINGQKMWTSLSSDADYCWLAVRTDPDAAKHKGISMILVPMDTPGITLSPLNLLGTHDINAVFFEDVRVPAANVVGGREPRLEAHHQPAQPRAGHAVRERRDGARAHRGHAVRARRRSSPTAAA